MTKIISVEELIALYSDGVDYRGKWLPRFVDLVNKAIQFQYRQLLLGEEIRFAPPPSRDMGLQHRAWVTLYEEIVEQLIEGGYEVEVYTQRTDDDFALKIRIPKRLSSDKRSS